MTGKLDGWDASVTRVHDPDDPNPDSLDNVRITLHRAKGPLIFDLGICLVLIALPALALWVAIPMALGRTSFVPPFITWYGSNGVRHCPAAKYPARLTAARLVDRPGRGAVGVDRAGRRDGPVRDRLVAQRDRRTPKKT